MLHQIDHTDIFEVEAEALVNPVNCVGVMGRGLARQFRHRFPQCFQDYVRACRDGSLRPGSVHVHPTQRKHPPLVVINLPTKDHWRDPSQLSYIIFGVAALADALERYQIKSVAIPPLGCGLGGLDWDDVRPVIEDGLASLANVEVTLIAPSEPAPTLSR